MFGYEKVKDLGLSVLNPVSLWFNEGRGWIHLMDGSHAITLSRDEIRALRDYLNHEWVDPDAGKEQPK